MAGQKEYEVELQFTAGLLSSPDRTRTQEENIDGEKAIFGSKSDMQSQNGMSRLSFRSGSIVSSQVKIDETNSEASTSKDPNNPNILVVDSPTPGGSSEGGGSGTSVRKVMKIIKKISLELFIETLTTNCF